MTSQKIMIQERKLLVRQLKLISTHPSIWGLNESLEIYSKHVFHILMTTIREWSFEETETVWRDVADTHFHASRFTFERLSNREMVNCYWENSAKSLQIIRQELAMILEKFRDLHQEVFPHIAKWVDFLIKQEFEFENPLFADEVLTNLVINSFVDENVQLNIRNSYKIRCQALIKEAPNDLMGYVGLKPEKRIFPHPVPANETERLKLGVKEILSYWDKQGIPL